MRASGGRWGRIGLITAAAIAVLAGAGVAGHRYLCAAPVVEPPTGTLNVNTNPPGALVSVDGQAHGVSPLSVHLPPGSHRLEVHAPGSEARVVTVTIAPHSEVAQYLDLPTAAAAWGGLQVVTEPAGARVAVDGAARGVAPVTLSDLTPGPHTIELEGPQGSVKQQVVTQAGVTTSLVVPMVAAPGGPVSGWVAVHAPIELQVSENGRLVGTTTNDRITLTAGRHDLEIASEPLGVRLARTVTVAPGKVASIDVDLPQQQVAINAVPWAEVSVDGRRVGETPIGSVLLPVGPHEVVFRHPTLGERRKTVTVTAGAPARVSIDLRN